MYIPLYPLALIAVFTNPALWMSMVFHTFESPLDASRSKKVVWSLAKGERHEGAECYLLLQFVKNVLMMISVRIDAPVGYGI